MNEIRNIPHYLEKDILAKESNATCCHTHTNSQSSKWRLFDFKEVIAVHL
jgi:hypothetical protein